MDAKPKKKSRFLIPPLIILIGILILVALTAVKKKPVREQHEVLGALVEVMETYMTDRTVVIEGHGTVKPRYEFTLTPQVMGRVEWVHEDLVAGGKFRKSDIMLRIEQRDYELAVQQAEAAVAQAQFQFELAQANAEIARKEWEMMNSNGKNGTGNDEPDPLVLHIPQLKQAEAALASAQASLEMANLNFERTELVAPYNCRIRRISVSPGQLVSASTPVAILYTTDVAEVEVGLPVSDLVWLEVPGAKATLTMHTGDGNYSWDGYVDRSVGVLDEIGRLAQIVVKVNNPSVKPSPDHPELSIGSFLRVELDGKQIENTVALPRTAIRENNTVWIANDKDELEIREVSTIYMTQSEALLASGIDPGERVVLTTVAGASNGMKLRPIDINDSEQISSSEPQESNLLDETGTGGGH